MDKGFKAPPESVHEAINPRIWVLVVEVNGRENGQMMVHVMVQGMHGREEITK